MENKFKYVVLGFLVILGILGYIFKSSSILYYLLISLLAGYLISTAVDHLVKEAKNKGKMSLLTWLGSAILILSGIMIMVFNVTNIVFGILVFLGMFALMISFFYYIGMEEPKDERLKKIGTTATTYSWHLTLLIICSILISTIWSGNESISIASLGFILFVMVATMIGVNIYLNRKGDVN